MPRFRPCLTPPEPLAALPDLLTVGQLIDALMQPGHFFVAPSLHLTWSAAKAEDVPWEVFRGRLVDAAHTRRQARLLSWHVVEETGNPLISVRLDVHAAVVHVTRGILCYVWEGYDAGDNVIESREVQRWTTELVGSAELAQFPDVEELRDELVCLIWQAVVGTSRLPLHSVEAPLPAFTFGQLHYCYRPWAENVAVPMDDGRTLLNEIDITVLSHREKARILELALRQGYAYQASQIADGWLATHSQDGMRLLRTVLNETSLSPYTSFADNLLAFADRLPQRCPVAQRRDFFAESALQLCRHLTAYDLVTFHHRGANYPDALLLDSLFIGLLLTLRSQPALFSDGTCSSRALRRALRQGFLVRRHYQAHLVPDAPTSPGENARVLPPAHARVPEEQLVQPHRRQRRLFADQPRVGAWPNLARVLTQSLHDLHDPAEHIELGIGLFIDRPLGYSKEAGEPDYTPLLAHEAFSPSIARQRLKELAALAKELSLKLPDDFFTSVERGLNDNPVRGVPATLLAEPARPTAALADARRVADDFVIVRTMPKGLAEMLDYFALPPMPKPHVVANVQSPRGPVLAFFDADYRGIAEAVVDTSAGFFRRAGIELPVAGLRILTIDGADVGHLHAPRREPGADSGSLPSV